MNNNSNLISSSFYKVDNVSLSRYKDTNTLQRKYIDLPGTIIWEELNADQLTNINSKAYMEHLNISRFYTCSEDQKTPKCTKKSLYNLLNEYNNMCFSSFNNGKNGKNGNRTYTYTFENTINLEEKWKLPKILQMCFKMVKIPNILNTPKTQKKKPVSVTTRYVLKKLLKKGDFVNILQNIKMNHKLKDDDPIFIDMPTTKNSKNLSTRLTSQVSSVKKTNASTAKATNHLNVPVPQSAASRFSVSTVSTAKAATHLTVPQSTAASRFTVSTVP